MSIKIKNATIGSISRGTLRTSDLFQAFGSELERQFFNNGDFFGRPENFDLRDTLNRIIGEWEDNTDDDGKMIDEELAEEMVNKTLPETLQSWFTPPFAYFGAHPGDGSDFGFWPMKIDDIKEQIEFFSTKDREYPDHDFVGEWLHINERGNCTLYVREVGNDTEIWSVV